MTPSEIRNKRILFSALNWGMGHVSRCIGLIQQLEKNGNVILIACDSAQKSVFEEYFPSLLYLNHEGYPFRFNGKGNFEMDLVGCFPILRKRMSKEVEEVTTYLSQNKIDLIISDHRYGFRNDNTTSIFITHQLNLPVKWYASFIQKWHEKLMTKFNFIWVMDFDDNRLAGNLSKKKKGLPADFIGPYSRFMFQENMMNQNGGEVLIASGPVIYAKQFVDEQLPFLNKDDAQVIAASSIEIPNEWVRVSNQWKAQDVVIMNASKIISRSGYSTIMDLHFLKKSFEMYPTKGQAEQEYLAKINRTSEP